jgi:hypothetical protein
MARPTRESDVIRIVLQYFEGCPNWQLAQQRLRRTLSEAGLGGVEIEFELVDSPEAAERLGFRGSPTILIDGRDPFATKACPLDSAVASIRRRWARRVLQARLS